MGTHQDTPAQPSMGLSLMLLSISADTSIPVACRLILPRSLITCDMNAISISRDSNGLKRHGLRISITSCAPYSQFLYGNISNSSICADGTLSLSLHGLWIATWTGCLKNCSDSPCKYCTLTVSPSSGF